VMHEQDLSRGWLGQTHNIGALFDGRRRMISDNTKFHCLAAANFLPRLSTTHTYTHTHTHTHTYTYTNGILFRKHATKMIMKSLWTGPVSHTHGDGNTNREGWGSRPATVPDQPYDATRRIPDGVTQPHTHTHIQEMMDPKL
jgi:hypothetical protein